MRGCLAAIALLLCGVCPPCCVVLGSSSRLMYRIYEPMSTQGSCFRRTNGTHQFGCSSNLEGNVGVVQLIRDEKDVQVVVQEGPHPPYVAVFYPHTFSKDYLVRMRDSERIAGAILIASQKRGFSDDMKCPNPYSSLYLADEEGSCEPQNIPWNPSGSDMLLEDFSFPIFLTTDNDTAEFLTTDCFKMHNSGADASWPLCAVELKSHMYAAVDTETCVRRSDTITNLQPTKYCDEMGDFNTFLFLEERNGTTQYNDSIILVSARLDSYTMFDGVEYTSDTPITGLVTFLETARLLAKQRPTFEGKVSNILFSLFYGEAFDYIGSNRFVYDMKEGLFPDELDNETFTDGQQPLLHIEHLHSVLELGQLYNVKADGKLFIHTDSQLEYNANFVSRLAEYGQQSGLWMRAASRKGLPPSSTQSLLKSRRDLPAMFISDFDKQYTNSFFHSIFDRGDTNLDYSYEQGPDQAVVGHIAQLAEALAQYLYELASGDDPRQVRVPTFQANRTGINNMLTCYLDSANCSLFRAASTSRLPPNKGSFPSYPYPQYVGVDYNKQHHGTFTRNLLALLTAEELDDVKNEADCEAHGVQNVYEYLFMAGQNADDNCTASVDDFCGHCYKTLSFRRAAVSPAFIVEAYNFSSNEYPTWAESIWKERSARIFLKGDPALDCVFFGIGLMILILSGVLVFFGQYQASEIFVTMENDSGLLTDSGMRANVAAPGVPGNAERGSNATMVTNTTTESQPEPAAL